VDKGKLVIFLGITSIHRDSNTVLWNANLSPLRCAGTPTRFSHTNEDSSGYHHNFRKMCFNRFP